MSASKWDDRYRKGELLDRASSPLLESAWRFWCGPPGRALDLACGPGRHALELARRGWRVTAVDASSTAIRHLHARAAAAGLPVDCHVIDLEASPGVIEPATYDLIADFCYLQRDLFPRIVDGLRPGGLLVAELLLRDTRPGAAPTNPAFLLNPGELPRLVAPLTVLVYDEGAARHHQRPLAQLIARRD